jgi:hypothetical protein
LWLVHGAAFSDYTVIADKGSSRVKFSFGDDLAIRVSSVDEATLARVAAHSSVSRIVTALRSAAGHKLYSKKGLAVPEVKCSEQERHISRTGA